VASTAFLSRIRPSPGWRCHAPPRRITAGERQEGADIRAVAVMTRYVLIRIRIGPA
jgi:hypothetical protein